jgi:hypothetical protein
MIGKVPGRDDAEIARVDNSVAEIAQRLVDARNTQCCRSHARASAAGTFFKGNTDKSDRSRLYFHSEGSVLRPVLADSGIKWRRQIDGKVSEMDYDYAD